MSPICNNAGAALRPQVVTDAVIGHLQREAEIGGYEAADEAKDALAHTYDALGRLLGCSPTEIALVENARVRSTGLLLLFLRNRAIGSSRRTPSTPPTPWPCCRWPDERRGDRSGRRRRLRPAHVPDSKRA